MSEEEIRRLTEVVRLNPQDHIAYNNRGLAYNNLKEYHKSFNDFKSCLEIDPSFTIASENLKLAQSQMKKVHPPEPVVSSERKFAFVVGQNVEGRFPLRYPFSDCCQMTAKLKSLGYEIDEAFYRTNEPFLTYSNFRRCFVKFLRKVEKGDKVVFYYSGHGYQKDGRNFLQCVQNEDEFEDMELSYLIQEFRRKGSVNIFFLDCCQDDPTDTTWGEKGGPKPNPLGNVDADDGQFVFGYACLPGKRALEKGEVGGGVFTHYLLKNMNRQGITLYFERPSQSFREGLRFSFL